MMYTCFNASPTGNTLFRVTPPKETAGLGGLTPYTIGFNGHLHIHPRDTLANLAATFRPESKQANLRSLNPPIHPDTAQVWVDLPRFRRGSRLLADGAAPWRPVASRRPMQRPRTIDQACGHNASLS